MRVKFKRSAKDVTLTDARLDVLDLFQDYRYLPLKYAARLLDYTPTTVTAKGKTYIVYEYFREEIGRLYASGYVECVNSIHYRQGVYALTPKGEKALKANGRYRGIAKTGEP